MKMLADFTVPGSPRTLASAIETCAQERRLVSALVVPWESDATRLSVAVTAVKADGWAIEHTNLGTITLTDLGDERTRVAIVAHESDHPEPEKLAAVLVAFARQVQQRLGAA